MDSITNNLLFVLEPFIKKNGLTKTVNKIGLSPTNFYRLKNGSGRFTTSQIRQIAKLTKCNLNWVFGFEKNKYIAGQENRSTLSESLEIISNELKSMGL